MVVQLIYQVYFVLLLSHYVDAVQSTDLVEDACFQLKDEDWCEKVIFCGNNVILNCNYERIVDFGRS